MPELLVARTRENRPFHKCKKPNTSARNGQNWQFGNRDSIEKELVMPR